MKQPLERTIAYLISSLAGAFVIGLTMAVSVTALINALPSIPSTYLIVVGVGLVVGINAWATMTLLRYDRRDRLR